MSANGYARATGREMQAASPSPQPSTLKGDGVKLPQLTAAAQERVATNRALVHEHMPEMLPVIKELHELGLIAGWRNVEEVTVLSNQDAGNHP